MIAFVVACAGGFGSICRFLLDSVVGQHTHGKIPLGTIAINVLGSFLLGVITGWWTGHGGDPALRLALGVGFCGGFTTFSTACVETARLARADGNTIALVHSMGMLAASVLAAFGGMALGHL